MSKLRDGRVDLIVTSPPYWVDPQDPGMQPCLLRSDKSDPTSAGGATDTPDTYAGLLDLLCRCFAECQRALKPGGFCCVNVASTRVSGSLYPLPFDLAVRLIAMGWVLEEDICWRRWRGWDSRGGVVIQNPYPGYFRPNRVWEHVLVFRKPGPPIYRGRTPEEKEDSRIATEDPLLPREINHDMWHVLPVHPRRRHDHPCPYPEELPARLIELYTYKDDLVLDPFAGSGTTGRVARLLGRRFLGYEVNPKFAHLARQRLEDASPLRRERRVCRFETLPRFTNATGPESPYPIAPDK
jgi:site-specific DNA-methyltransferase (adenine-specific)